MKINDIVFHAGRKASVLNLNAGEGLVGILLLRENASYLEVPTGELSRALATAPAPVSDPAPVAAVVAPPRAVSPKVRAAATAKGGKKKVTAQGQGAPAASQPPKL